MIKETYLSKQLSFSNLCLDLYPLGDDIAAVLYGGEKPHVGCSALAVPRPSLMGTGEISCTSSVLNVPGHKDEQLCRYTAEVLCKKTGAVVVCSGGFHQDRITQEQIGEVINALDQLLRESFI